MARHDADLQQAVDASSAALDAGSEDDLVQILRDQLAERGIETGDTRWLEQTADGIRSDRNYMVESEPEDYVPHRDR